MLNDGVRNCVARRRCVESMSNGGVYVCVCVCAFVCVCNKRLLRLEECVTRSVWDRGSYHIGNGYIDSEGRGRWCWGLPSVAVVWRTAVEKVMCRGLWCRELSRAVLLGTTVSRIFER